MPILTRGGNITQTLAAASPQWSEYHSLLSIVTRGREYHSDTGCCLTSIENTTPSCLSSLRGRNINQTLAAASPQERIPLPPVYRHSGREYHSDTGCCLTSGDSTTPSCLSSLGGGNITQTLAAASPQERIPLPPVYPHCGREYHSDTGCSLTSGDNETPSCLSSLVGGNITQTLAAVSPQEKIPLPPVYPHCGEGISLRHWLLPHLRRQYHFLLSILTWGREYHSDTGCCLTSGENTTPSCLSSLGVGKSLRHWLLPHLRRQYHSLLPILTVAGNITQTLAAASPEETIPLPLVYPHYGWEYHSYTGCYITSGDNNTPSCLSSLGDGISLRHWLLPHLRRQYHSLLPILTRGREYHSDTGCCLTSGDNTTPSCLSSLRAGNITQTLAAASPQETVPLPPAYPHAGWEYHSDTGCCLTSLDNTTPTCLSSLGVGISLRHWLLSHLRRKYHSLLSIVTCRREYHSDTGCCLTSGDNTTPSCLSSLWEGISLRHSLLPHFRREYHALLSILTRGGNITQTLAAASLQERIPLPPVYPHSGQGISLRHWLLSHLRREYHSLLSIVTWGREYQSDTGCCLTSGDNTTPSCLSSLLGENITQTLAAVSPQEKIPLSPVYRHLGEGISLRHCLLPHLKREYHSLLSIVTRGREYHSDTGCCLTSGDNTTPFCLSSLGGGNITQTLAAASPQERIPLPPVYRHSGEGISLRHWLLPHLRRQYHSLLSIVTWGREYHSDTGCCLTSVENLTRSCVSSLDGGNITQTLAVASPQ